jgi:hypothetical protein
MSAAARVPRVPRLDCGIQAPGIRSGMFVAGVRGLGVAAMAASSSEFSVASSTATSQVAAAMVMLGVVVAIRWLFMAADMT